MYLPRAGYAFAAGFPLPLLEVYERRALEAGLTVVDVRERPAPWGAARTIRDAVEALVPLGAASSGGLRLK